MIGRYPTLAAYRQALEARLMASYGSERVQRGRKLLAIERLVVRLQEQRPSGFLVKGGFALEIRLSGRCRTTRDLDVSADAEIGLDSESVADSIEDACGIDARDGFEFRLRGAPEKIAPSGDALTLRFSIEANLAGRIFERVPVDVRLRDFIPETADSLPGSDTLRIIGLERPYLRVVPLEFHMAEKIHALIRPRIESNTRVRDLVDVNLLIGLGTRADGKMKSALAEVFRSSRTDLPAELPPAPPGWEEAYLALARQAPGVPADVATAWRAVGDFYRNISR